MKTVLKCIASVVIGFLIWFILYMVISMGLFTTAFVIPLVAKLMNWIASFYGHILIQLVLPAYASALVVRWIMKDSSNRANIKTTIIIICVIAIDVLGVKAFSALEKYAGIGTMGYVYWDTVVNS